MSATALSPASDSYGAMTEAIERLKGEGWEAESSDDFGFTFLRGATERRLLMLTPRDPQPRELQTFNPFRSTFPRFPPSRIAQPLPISLYEVGYLRARGQASNNP